jgi:mitochondrial division protein 1
MTPRMANATASASSRPRAVATSNTSQARVDFATIGRAPMKLTLGSRRITSGDLQIVEATEELLAAEVPDESATRSNVSLMRGFNATIPSAEKSRTRRRQMRNIDAPRIGLKKLGMNARGLLMDDEGDELGEEGDHDHEGQSIASEDDMVVVGRADDRGRKGKGRGRESLSTAKTLGKEELKRQTREILRDKENLHVRRVRRVLHSVVYANLNKYAQVESCPQRNRGNNE